MSKPLAPAVFFSMTALFSEPAAVLAQATTPSPPGAPQATPDYRGCEISTAADGAFLWVVDNIQHVVTLCEKTDDDRDFNCTTKPLP
jgi:hypothetical protein